MTRFANRRHAGRALGAILEPYRTVQPTILALPRGGVPVAYEVARTLDAPFDVFTGAMLDAPVKGRTVILVDDGMVTGESMRGAIRALRPLEPRHIVVGAPVASRQAIMMARNEADDWACVIAPDPFVSVGAWYSDFRQVSEDEVRSLLNREPLPRRRSGAGSTVHAW